MLHDHSRHDDLFRVAFESSPSGMLVVDADGTVVLANAEAARIFGCSRPELIGASIDTFVPAAVRATHATSRSTAADPGFHRGLGAGRVFPGVRRDGTQLDLEIGLNAIETPDGRRILASFVDVTERQSFERQYRQAQKMETVGRLAGGIAHDFNNLLTVISSYISLVLTEHVLTATIRDDLEEVGKAAASAATLTRQLLAFSRKQVLETRPLDLNDVVRDAQKMLGRVIGEDVKLETTLGEPLGCVQADFGQIEQVVMNLAVNARDAMPNGGRLTLETENIEVAEDFTRDNFSAKAGPFVKLSVRDTGLGMSAETRARIFEPFFTTKESGKGTGLGLSMVSGIVQQNAGFITVHSVPGRGTDFDIYLPRISDRAVVDATVSAPVAARGTETILLVEDVFAVREIVRRLLVDRGYTVLAAADATNALALAGAQPGPIHLLLTDVVLPGMSGRELAERLKPVRSELKVLFTSGYTDDAVVRRGVLDHSIAFVQKPFTPDVLARRVREVLG